MSETAKPCPECVDQPAEGLDRRIFIKTAAVGAVAAAVPPALRAADAKPATLARPEQPAEAMIKELFAALNADQKAKVIKPWDHGVKDGKGTPTRLGMYNRPIDKPLGEVYTPAQQGLIEKILRSIASDGDGYRCITRNGTFDGSKTLQGCGVDIFGDPSGSAKYSWVFSGHHITVRCDGNSEEGAAFGGPTYYGHSPNGYSPNNVFFYQTKAVLSVWDALNEEQRKQAVFTKNPGEQAGSVKFRPANEAKPGIAYAALTKDQRELVGKVMHNVLSPYRKEDADEVMEIIKTNGGMEKIHLGFFKDNAESKQWDFWRLEGPGFVWNYRVLPHVHCFVNISSKLA